MKRRSFFGSLCAGISAVLWGRSGPPATWLESKTTERTADLLFRPEPPIEPLAPITVILRATADGDFEVGDTLYWDKDTNGLVKVEHPPAPGLLIAIADGKKGKVTEATFIG